MIKTNEQAQAVNNELFITYMKGLLANASKDEDVAWDRFQNCRDAGGRDRVTEEYYYIKWARANEKRITIAEAIQSYERMFNR